MSIQFKVPIYILASFLLNILFIGLYYNLSLSHTISDKYIQNMEALELSARQIADEAEASEDYRELLRARSERDRLIFDVTDPSGDLLFHSGVVSGVNLNMSAAAMFDSGGEILLLKVTMPVSLEFMSSFDYITDLFIGEFVIISFTLLLLWLILYLNSVRPLMDLRRSIRMYKRGIKPERTRRRDEFGQLHNAFAALTDSLDEEKQLQNRIIASISHDIKTPLTSVMGYAERLRKESLNPERRESYIHTIYEKSRRIKETVDEFDEYVNFQLQSALKMQTLTAGAFCRMLEEEYCEELSYENVRFTVRCESPERRFSADTAKLRRVFGNIIGNSLKYARQQPEIDLYCRSEGKSLLFSVCDNGPGVPEDSLDKLFEPFYTSDQGRRVAGLGLSICRSIAESHGGSIGAEIGPLGGLCVTLRLPLL